MPGIFHTQIALNGYDFPDYQLTCKISGAPVAADVGKAVSQDAANANSVQLAADNAPIIGYLMTFEDRIVEGQKVGTVSFKFAQKLKIKAGETVIVGDRLIGAGAGEVKAHPAPSTAALAATFADAPRVFAVAGGFATALYL